MLTEICQYLRNWFEREKWTGGFAIVNGELTRENGTTLPLLPGQYFRVIGSVFNDGVHVQGDTLIDEDFTGAVWSMAVPPDFVALVEEIGAWNTTNAAAISSPYQSESFGGYSYSLKSGNSAAGDSGGATWRSQFASRLAPWRKI